MESGLTFNQLICEFESRHPRVYLRFEISDFPVDLHWQSAIKS